ncbi:50S ribosomal protein L24e [Candidatus Woesearchaeota archaeon]|nr:50S ribosomal protein L24e [Candidatus Woesearchaeota archaeon]
MVKCSFCNSELEKGTGMMYVKKDGRILWFDKKKCEKNMLGLGRKSHKLKWITSQQKKAVKQ